MQVYLASRDLSHLRTEKQAVWRGRAAEKRQEKEGKGRKEVADGKQKGAGAESRDDRGFRMRRMTKSRVQDKGQARVDDGTTDQAEGRGVTSR
eukprot:172304-Hanusia_phi.AAC.4